MTKRKRKANADAMSAWLKGVPMKRLGMTETALRAEFQRLTKGVADIYTDCGAIIASIDTEATASKASPDQYLAGVRHGMLDMAHRCTQAVGHACNRLLLNTVTGGDDD